MAGSECMKHSIAALLRVLSIDVAAITALGTLMISRQFGRALRGIPLFSPREAELCAASELRGYKLEPL